MFLLPYSSQTLAYATAECISLCVNSGSQLVVLFWETVEPFGHGMVDVTVVTVHQGYTFGSYKSAPVPAQALCILIL